MPSASSASDACIVTAKPLRATVSGLCATLVGLGLARFAYTPLLPAIVAAHWFSSSNAAYLGAANLVGYLAGALFAGRAAQLTSSHFVLRAGMISASVALIACAWPIDFAWFFIWRFVAGFAGGALMVLAAPTVLPHIPPARRGLASGAIFMGVGLGIAASGTLVPMLLRGGLTQTWMGLGGLSLLLTFIAWRGWPQAEPVIAATRQAAQHRRPTRPLRALYIEYGLNAVALVPHMIFLVDFIARGLGKGLEVGAQYWVLFGAGAAIGPVLSGSLADRIGFRPALILAYGLQAAAIAVVALGFGGVWLALSSLIIGAFTPGIVPLVLGRVNELLIHHPALQKAAWRSATTSFAIFQAMAAYGMSFVFSLNGGDYYQLFMIAAGAAAAALLLDVSLGGHRPDS